MKKHFIYLMAIAITMAAFTSCCEKEETGNGQPQMTMTTQKNDVLLRMAGSGTMTINWGDGTSATTYALSTTNVTDYNHMYSATQTHSITITGDNITVMDCSNNQITNLDVSKNTALTHLSCRDNQLTTLGLNKNTALTELRCPTNQITALDVSKNTALTRLECFGNQLAALDVSKNTALTGLECSYNQLTALDVSKNTALTELYCDYNQLTAAALNALFGTLHSNTIERKMIFIGYNPGTATCDISIAENKGWRVFSD